MASGGGTTENVTSGSSGWTKGGIDGGSEHAELERAGRVLIEDRPRELRAAAVYIAAPDGQLAANAHAKKRRAARMRTDPNVILIGRYRLPFRLTANQQKHSPKTGHHLAEQPEPAHKSVRQRPSAAPPDRAG